MTRVPVASWVRVWSTRMPISRPATISPLTRCPSMSCCATLRPIGCPPPGDTVDQDDTALCLPADARSNQPLQVLTRGVAVRLRHPHGHHIGEVDDHAILVCLTVVPRPDQHQAAPLVQSTSARL